MSPARDPEDVLASIRRLVAREVSNAQARDEAERPVKPDVPVFSSRASAAARKVMKPGDYLAANGMPHPEAKAGAAGRGISPHPEPKPRFTPRPSTLHLDHPVEPPNPRAERPLGPFAYLTEDELREIIREIFREEVRTRMGPRINENIRKIVQQELAKLFPDDGSA
mgnify:CR=1 FL=1